MRSQKTACATAIALWLGAGVGGATTYVMVADEDLTDGASVIALVRVIDREVVEVGSTIFTDFLVEPRRVVKGDALPRMRLRRLGGQLPDGRGLILAGMPELEVGGEALVFLIERADGTYGFKHLMLGAFRVRTIGGARLAHRPGDSGVVLNLDDARRQHRLASLLQAHLPRDLERFMRWMAERAAGGSRPGDYYLDEEILADVPVEKFNLLLLGGELFHWHEFSPGADGFIAMVMQKAGLKGKGSKAMKATLKAWSKIFRIDVRFGGKEKDATAGHVARDGFNAWLFGDPNDEIAGSYSCATGGVLAIGGPFVSSTGVAHSATGSGGKRSYFGEATEGDVVFQDNIECAFARAGARPAFDDFVSQVGAHEVGTRSGWTTHAVTILAGRATRRRRTTPSCVPPRTTTAAEPRSRRTTRTALRRSTTLADVRPPAPEAASC